MIKESPMARSRRPTPRELARARFHELVGELRRLTVAFPELHDAADEDDLPIRFLLRRGADRARDRAARRRAAAARRPAAGARKK
jgi:hypothetical protein